MELKARIYIPREKLLTICEHNQTEGCEHIQTKGHVKTTLPKDM